MIYYKYTDEKYKVYKYSGEKKILLLSCTTTSTIAHLSKSNPPYPNFSLLLLCSLLFALFPSIPPSPYCFLLLSPPPKFSVSYCLLLISPLRQNSFLQYISVHCADQEKDPRQGDSIRPMLCFDLLS